MTDDTLQTDLSDQEFRVLFNLRKIPQRNDNFMILHGADIAVAESLTKRGLVVETRGEYPPGTDEAPYRGWRLNKPSRTRLLAEWDGRGQPSAKQVEELKDQT